MSSSRKNSRKRGKRPTATIDLKAKEVPTGEPKTGTSGTQAPKTDAKAQAASSGAAKPATPSPAGRPTGATAQMKQPQARPESDKPAKPADASGASGKTSASAKAEKNDTATPSGTTSDKTDDGGMRGALTHLVAGGLGGILALFGAQQFLPPAQELSTGTQGTPAISEAVESRLAALETSAASSTTPSETVAKIPSELLERVGKLEALNETLAGMADTQNKLTNATSELGSKIATLSDPSGGGAVELRSRLDAMEGTIASLGKAAEGADGKAIPQLAALAGRINDLQTQLESKVAAARKATAADLESRFAAVESALEKAGTGDAATQEALSTLTGGNKRVSLALETARTETERLAKDVLGLKEITGGLDTKLAETTEVVTGLTSRLDESQAKTTESLAALPSMSAVTGLIAPVEQKLGAVEEKVASVLAREETRTNSAKQIVLALELANLRRALDRGQNVSGEIARIKKTAPASIDLAPLDKLAASKVPSREQLASEFRGVSRKIIQAESNVEGTSAFDQLLANARSIVRVRKTGDVEGNTAEAVVARTEDAVKRGDLKSSLLELKKLSGEAALAANDWITRVRDRLAIDATLEQIEAGLKTSVSSATTN